MEEMKWTTTVREKEKINDNLFLFEIEYLDENNKLISREELMCESMYEAVMKHYEIYVDNFNKNKRLWK